MSENNFTEFKEFLISMGVPADGFSPGLPEESIREAEALFGMPLTQDLRETYLLSNGSPVGGARIVLQHRWLALNDEWRTILRTQRSMADTEDKDMRTAREIEVNRSRGPAYHVYGDHARFPLAVSGSESKLFVDFRPGPSGTRGQIIEVIDGESRVLAPSLYALFARLMDLTQAKMLKFSPDNGFSSKVPTLTASDVIVGVVPERRLSDARLWKKVETVWKKLCPELPNGGLRAGASKQALVTRHLGFGASGLSSDMLLDFGMRDSYRRHDGMLRGAPDLFVGIGRWLPIEELAGLRESAERKWKIRRSKRPFLQGAGTAIGAVSLEALFFTTDEEMAQWKEVASSLEVYIERVLHHIETEAIMWDKAKSAWLHTSSGEPVLHPL